MAWLARAPRCCECGIRHHKHTSTARVPPFARVGGARRLDSMALTLCACLAQSCLKGVCEKLNVPDAEDNYINFSLHTCLDGVTSACVCVAAAITVPLLTVCGASADADAARPPSLPCVGEDRNYVVRAARVRHDACWCYWGALVWLRGLRLT